jgi:hypothetical protein
VFIAKSLLDRDENEMSEMKYRDKRKEEGVGVGRSSPTTASLK